VLYAPLAEIDPEVKNIIDKETWRQFTGLELIASEVRRFRSFRIPWVLMGIK
jgi:glycine/serine hydroxymethyltransferase